MRASCLTGGCALCQVFNRRLHPYFEALQHSSSQRASSSACFPLLLSHRSYWLALGSLTMHAGDADLAGRSHPAGAAPRTTATAGSGGLRTRMLAARWAPFIQCICSALVRFLAGGWGWIEMPVVVAAAAANQGSSGEVGMNLPVWRGLHAGRSCRRSIRLPEL